MKLKSSSIIKSPDRADHVRLCAEVEYETAGIQPEPYWFEVHEKYQPFLSDTGNPWIMCLVPAAITLGEPLRLNMPVDAALLKNTHELMKIWSFWFPRLKPMPIEAETIASETPKRDSKTLSFFSGGVDAFFTALYHNETSDPFDRLPIDDLVNIWGFDIPYSRREAYFKMQGSLKQAATMMGKELVAVATNLRETQLKKCEWEYLYHGPALASVAYALEKRYRLALIASSGGYHETFPQGSHPALMPLFSSTGMQVRQSGATFDRVQKIEWISRFDVVKRTLHVCFHLGNEQNCSRCIKCYHTMITLDLLGRLGEFQTFDRTQYTHEKTKRIFLWGQDDREDALDIHALALYKKRPEIADAMIRSIRHTARVKRSMKLLDRLRKLTGGKKLYSRAEQWLFKDTVGGEERYYPASSDSLFANHYQVYVIDQFVWKNNIG